MKDLNSSHECSGCLEATSLSPPMSKEFRDVHDCVDDIWSLALGTRCSEKGMAVLHHRRHGG